MRFEQAARFDTDFKRLRREHRQRFLAVVPAFNAACDAFAASPAGFTWPSGTRVSRMSSAPGIWEMTWSFASPDGRATFEFVQHDGVQHLRWRRIGDHSIYTSP